MFHNIPEEVRAQMKALEEQDGVDREDGTPMLKRLRQIPPETGKFLALLAASAPAGKCLEVGTSGGYSALWLSLAMDTRGEVLTTFELLPDKAKLARKTFKEAKVNKLVEVINGDARGHVGHFDEVAFCFVDCEKEMYKDVYEVILSKVVSGGILAFDNVISHQADLQAFVDQVEADVSVDSSVVPVGKGILFVRKI